MKNISFTLLILLLSITVSFGQRSREYSLVVGDNYSGEALNVFDLRNKRGTVGDYYWNENWAEGSIKLINGKTIQDMPMKYDLQSNGLEIQVTNDIKVLPGELVEEFVIVKLNESEEEIFHRFIRLDLFFDVDVIDQSFYELLQEGEKVTLLRKTDTEILEPNYVAILDAGSVKSKVIKKEKVMIFDGVKLDELPKGKNRMIKVLSKYKSGIADFWDDNKLKPKQVDELKKLIVFVNS
jgi:hypothetical protein